MRHSILAACLFLGACSSPVPHEATTVHDAGKDSATPSYEASVPTYETGVEAGLVVGSPIEAGSFDLGYPDNSPMLYHGGPVMTAPIQVYIVWYGDWQNRQSTMNTIEYMIQNIGASSVFQINTKYSENVASATSLPETVDGGDAGYYPDAAVYPDAGTEFVSGGVNLAASIYSYVPDYIQLMDDTDIRTLIQTNITNGMLPLDPNGVYFVLTSADIIDILGILEQSCDEYCGYHNSMTFQNTDIKYSWVGDIARCPFDCSVEGEYAGLGIVNSPNNDWSADGMASIIEHELSEMATDPDVSGHVAWMSSDGSENADHCAWLFGTPYWTLNSSVANIKVGSKDFMLQEIFDLDNPLNDDNGHCSIQP